jgi:hypothetical protein
LCVVQNLKLVFHNFDTNAPGLFLHEHAVNASTFGTERSAIPGYFGAAVTGMEDPHDRAVLQRLDLVLSCHCQIVPVWALPGTDARRVGNVQPRHAVILPAREGCGRHGGASSTKGLVETLLW